MTLIINKPIVDIEVPDKQIYVELINKAEKRLKESPCTELDELIKHLTPDQIHAFIYEYKAVNMLRVLYRNINGKYPNDSPHGFQKYVNSIRSMIENGDKDKLVFIRDTLKESSGSESFMVTWIDREIVDFHLLYNVMV